MCGSVGVGHVDVFVICGSVGVVHVDVFGRLPWRDEEEYSPLHPPSSSMPISYLGGRGFEVRDRVGGKKRHCCSSLIILLFCWSPPSASHRFAVRQVAGP